MKRFFLAACLLASAYTSHAQTSDGNIQTLSLRMGDILDMKFLSTQGNTGSEVSMYFTKADDYYNGVESAPQTLSISSNKNFSISVRTSNDPNSNLTSFLYIKVPESKIESNNSDNKYKQLSSANVTLLEGGKSGYAQSFSVQYKAKPGKMIPPGVYSLNVIFTATSY